MCTSKLGLLVAVFLALLPEELRPSSRQTQVSRPSTAPPLVLDGEDWSYHLGNIIHTCCAPRTALNFLVIDT